MSRNRRFALACIVAPLVTPLVIDLFSVLEDPPVRSVEDFLTEVLIGATLYLPFAYAAELFLGVPLWGLFLRYRIRSMAAFALGGAFIGCVVILLLVANGASPMATVIGQPKWFVHTLPFVLAASASALVFRTIIQGGGA